MSTRKRDRGRTTMPAEFDPEVQAKVHAALGDERRLEIVDILASVGWIEQRPLAAEIASREEGRDVDPCFDEAGADDREAVGDVLLDLYCEHLPEMEDAGAVAYENEVIAQGPEFREALNARNATALSQGVPVGSVGGDST